jgi:hypothetical protein
MTSRKIRLWFENTLPGFRSNDNNFEVENDDILKINAGFKI